MEELCLTKRDRSIRFRFLERLQKVREHYAERGIIITLIDTLKYENFFHTIDCKRLARFHTIDCKGLARTVNNIIDEEKLADPD